MTLSLLLSLSLPLCVSPSLFVSPSTFLSVFLSLSLSLSDSLSLSLSLSLTRSLSLSLSHSFSLSLFLSIQDSFLYQSKILLCSVSRLPWLEKLLVFTAVRCGENFAAAALSRIIVEATTPSQVRKPATLGNHLFMGQNSSLVVCWARCHRVMQRCGFDPPLRRIVLVEGIFLELTWVLS